MKIYSDGKSRVLNGAFPKHFRLLNGEKEVPFIRTGRESIRISGELPVGDLLVDEIIRQKVAQPAKLDAQSIAIINKQDFDRIDILNKKLAINQEKMGEQMNALAEHEATLANLETKNAGDIELLSGQTASAVQMLKGAIEDTEKKNVAVQKALNQAIKETGEDLSDSLVAHETAKNPHRITKATIGLDKVENIKPEDMPVSKATKKELDKKADKKDIAEVEKKLTEKSDKIVKGIERMNMLGGVGGNELPVGGKKGQVLAKASNKTGDYEWSSAAGGVSIHNELEGRSAENAHPMSAITGLDSALTTETENRESADNGLQSQIDAITASSDVKDIVGTHADLEDYDTSTLGNNDIIKVLQDETQNDQTTYYRWNSTTQTFSLIGAEGPYYTKSESDTRFQAAGSYVTTNTDQDITATKTFKGQQKIQYGGGEGCLIVGADVSDTTLTENTRKLGRMAFPTYEGTVNCAFLSCDSQFITNSAINYLEFGGRPADRSCTSPDEIRFTVANTHNTLVDNQKKAVLDIDKSMANFTVEPRYNNAPLVTTNTAQTISATKTYTARQDFSSNISDKIYLKHGQMDITTTPSAKRSNTINFRDKNAVTMGYVTQQQDTDGSSKIRMVASTYETGTTESNVAAFEIKAYKDGTLESYIDTPPVNSNDNNIANTSWVKSQNYVDSTALTTTLADYVTIAGDETISGGKTFTKAVTIQNGAGTGALTFGANVNSSSITNNTRKLGRINSPSYASGTAPTATLLGWDTQGDTGQDDMHTANKATDVVSFGGMKKITTNTSPMNIVFCVTKTRGSSAAADKIYPLEMDANEARFNVQPNYNGTNLATVNDIPTTAAEVNALPDSTKYGADLDLTSGTLQLLDQDGNALGNSVTVPDTSDFVQKTGDTMTGTLTVAAGDRKFYLPQSGTTKGTAPSGTVNNQIVFNDSVNSTDTATSRLGIIEQTLDSSGNSFISIGAVRNTAGSKDVSRFQAKITNGGVASCSFPNTTCVDSGYVESSSTVANGVSLNGSSALSYTLSGLPNDGQKYMVLITGSAQTGTTSGNQVLIQITTTLNPSGVNLCRIHTRASSAMYTTGSCWIPVSSDRKIYLERSTNYNGTCNLYMKGYRRIGTNS